MADIALAGVRTFNDHYVATWETLTSANAAGAKYTPVKTEAAVASVQFTGTFDSATAVLQGSNDGTNWVTLNDLSGVAISFNNTTGAKEFSTAMLYIRPSTSGGGGSQDIDCIVVARG